MKAIFLKPLDTFFFRDHKELTAGEDNAASGLFPPRPGTFFGALRSAYIHKHSDFTTFQQSADACLKKWMGTPDSAGSFSIRGVFFHNGQEPMLPLPLDYQVVEQNVEGVSKEWAHRLSLRETDVAGRGSSDDTWWKLYGTRSEKSASATNAYLPLSLWKKAMLDGSCPVNVARAGQWLVSEPKLGIAREWKTRTVQEGMLYQMEMHRFAESAEGASPGFYILCDQTPDFESVPLATCGRGNKIWKLTEENVQSFLDDEEREKVIAGIKQIGIARIVLLTPAIWQNGSRPAISKENTLVFEPEITGLADSFSVDIITAAIGRPDIIGGWDMVKVRPKPRMYAVPAGTVLYVKVKPDDASKLVNTLEQIKLTDDLSHEGYGFALCAYN